MLLNPLLLADSISSCLLLLMPLQLLLMLLLLVVACRRVLLLILLLLLLLLLLLVVACRRVLLLLATRSAIDLSTLLSNEYICAIARMYTVSSVWFSAKDKNKLLNLLSRFMSFSERCFLSLSLPLDLVNFRYLSDFYYIYYSVNTIIFLYFYLLMKCIALSNSIDWIVSIHV